MTIYSLVVLFSQFEPVVPYKVLTVASWFIYNLLRTQVKWSGIPISLRIILQFVVIHTVKGFCIVSEADVDVFLEFSCFFYDSSDVSNLISGPPAFSKFSLYIWKFLVHALLKPNLKYIEHCLASMWNEHSCTVVWTLFGIALFWDWNESWTFSSSVAIAEFSKFAGILSAIL